LGFGLRFSPKRLVLGLSDQCSRLGERSSARLSEVTMKPVRVERDFSSRREVLRCWATDTLA